MLLTLGVQNIVSPDAANLENGLPAVDEILETVGPDTVERCLGALKTGGKIVSVVSSKPLLQRSDAQVIFFDPRSLRPG